MICAILIIGEVVVLGSGWFVFSVVCRRYAKRQSWGNAILSGVITGIIAVSIPVVLADVVWCAIKQVGPNSRLVFWILLSAWIGGPMIAAAWIALRCRVR